MKQRIAIQGHEGSYHSIAANRFFGEDIELVPCDTFAEAFLELDNGRADFALLAIENSLYGSINQVYDLLLKYRFWICGEVYLRVEHCLIGLPGTSIKQLKEVHSQAEALAQCETYLETELAHVDRVEHHDTAASVTDIKRWNDPTKAAIASEAAAKLHGLEILAQGIETNKANYTRFVALTRTPTEATDSDKTSLVLITDHQPGALYRALGSFADRNISLSKLQSRPIIGEAWHYMFYVDVLADQSSPAMTTALRELEQQKCDVTVLGSYRAGEQTPLSQQAAATNHLSA